MKFQRFFVLQSNTSVSYPYQNFTVGVTSLYGEHTKQLFDFAKNVHPPWAIDMTKSKLFAYYYTLRFAQQQSPAIVMMDLYNGSNLRTLKEFKYPNYSQVSLSAMVLDPLTGLLYYTRKTI